MSKYTYTRKYVAHMGADKSGRAIIPDQVAGDQKAYDGKTFPALVNGYKVRVMLRGDLYGLHTTGTGDATVTRA